jgi:hypothetical protein
VSVIVLCRYHKWANLIIKHVQIPHLSRSRNSVVSVVTRLWAGQHGIGILAGARDFSLVQNPQTGSEVQRPSNSVVTRSFPGGEESGV